MKFDVSHIVWLRFSFALWPHCNYLHSGHQGSHRILDNLSECKELDTVSLKKQNLWTDKCPGCSQARKHRIPRHREVYDLPIFASSALRQGVLAVHASEIIFRNSELCHRTEIISSTLASSRGLRAGRSTNNQKGKV
jgi:hypothetical protein